MSLSQGVQSTLPRSQSEIVVDFTRPSQDTEDEMSHDSLNEAELLRQSLPPASRTPCKNALFVDSDAEEEARPGPSGAADPTGAEETQSEARASSEDSLEDSLKGSSGRLSERKLRSLFGDPPVKPPSPGNFSFRSTLGLLPSSGKRRGLRQQVIVTFAVCLGPLACGFALAYNLTKNPSELLGPHLGPWKTYVYFLGCLSGGFFSGFLANYGRKVVVLVTMVPMALSWLLVIFATQVWMVFLFHATSGVCTGLVVVVVQVYVAEVSVPRVRGALSSAPVLAFQVGSLLCFLLGEILVWRNLAIVGVCVAMPVFLTVVLCAPESPRFLIHKHPNDALMTLQWLRGAQSDIMEEYHDISDSSDIDRWAIHCEDLLRPTFWRPLLLSCGLMFLYSMTGVSSFTLYAMELFAEVSSVYVNVAYFVVTVVLLIAITLSALLVDHIGRKLLLLLSLTIMAASSFVLGLFLFLKDVHRVDNYFVYQWVAEVFCVVLFTFAYGSGLAPIAWVTLGEIFSPQYKWLGVSMASMVLWSSMLAVDVLFHRLRLAVATGGIFWLHCVVCVAGYIFVLVCFRELKEQRIDSITKSFVKKHDSLIETFIARV
ncbi:facilitated trehalose transporter Tret1-like [Eriocheir sinensis]|uniref:facilitated trehalose transporter Tret1-like n=1 Tax=Eriocheir sinensis TaxID=95602 RepID=UPI0021C931F2|nr:facilitated trehalose transporter Tret1-like [Eriocheir sinensis]